MMNRNFETPAYVIGPYAAYEMNGRRYSEAVNVSRAVAIGAMALHRGYVPIIPYDTIGMCALLFGDDAEGLAREASYGGTAGGLAQLLGAWGRAADLAAGPPFVHENDIIRGLNLTVWVLEREDGSLSKGTEAELNRVQVSRGWAPTIYRHGWQGWRDMRPDMHDVFEAAERGDLVTNWSSQVGR